MVHPGSCGRRAYSVIHGELEVTKVRIVYLYLGTVFLSPLQHSEYLVFWNYKFDHWKDHLEQIGFSGE